MGGAEAGGLESSSYGLGTAANPGLRGTPKSAASVITVQAEEEADGGAALAGCGRKQGASPLHAFRCLILCD